MTPANTPSLHQVMRYYSQEPFDIPTDTKSMPRQRTRNASPSTAQVIRLNSMVQIDLPTLYLLNLLLVSGYRQMMEVRVSTDMVARQKDLIKRLAISKNTSKLGTRNGTTASC